MSTTVTTIVITSEIDHYRANLEALTLQAEAQPLDYEDAAAIAQAVRGLQNAARALLDVVDDPLGIGRFNALGRPLA